MDKERFAAGLAARKKVLGDAYVDKTMATAPEFSKPFQDLLTETCWGIVWGDDTLTFKERSMITLGMLAALGRFTEFELHFKGAITNGLSKEQLQAVLTQITMYCGAPVGVESFRTANRVFAEQEAAQK